VLERDVFATTHPIFEEMRSSIIDTLRRSKGRIPYSVGAVVSVNLLVATLSQHWSSVGIDACYVSHEALVLYLPQALSEGAQVITTLSPKVFNTPELNLRNNGTFLGWTFKLEGDNESTTVQVPEASLTGAVNGAYSHTVREWGWVPVVVVSGKSVEIGGFLVDESFICGVQGACMSAQSNVTDLVYSAQELQAAEELAHIHGVQPWIFERWSSLGEWTVQPQIYRCGAVESLDDPS
jgi:hypothetical protein